jgi:hypothetical protein
VSAATYFFALFLKCGDDRFRQVFSAAAMFEVLLVPLYALSKRRRHRKLMLLVPGFVDRSHTSLIRTFLPTLVRGINTGNGDYEPEQLRAGTVIVSAEYDEKNAQWNCEDGEYQLCLVHVPILPQPRFCFPGLLS